MACSLYIDKWYKSGHIQYELYCKVHRSKVERLNKELIAILHDSEIELNGGRFINYCEDDYGNAIQISQTGRLVELFDKSLDWININVNCKWSFRIHHLIGTNSFLIIFDFVDKNIATLFKLLEPYK